MAEYVERDALLRKIKRYGLSDGSVLGKHSGAAEELILEVELFPSADVAPVVHGKWVHPHWKNSNYCYDCSVCGREAMHQEYKWGDKKIYPICPNCGAKMVANHG